MNFYEMLQEVYVKTNRPDLVAQSISALRASTLKTHGVEFFAKDIKQGQVVFDTEAYIQVLDTSAIPRYRKPVFMRKQDPSLLAYEQNPTLLPPNSQTWQGNVPVALRLRMLRYITPDNIFDSYGQEKLDVFYQAGSQLLLKSSTALKYVLAGWYEFPNIDTTTPDGGLSFPNYSSWVANEHPFAIIYDAVATILPTIGKLDLVSIYNRVASGTDDGGLVQQEVKRLIADNIIPEDMDTAGGED